VDTYIYNFRWVTEGKLAGSSRPFLKKDFDWLYQIGIRAIVCLLDCPLYEEEAQRLGFKYLHLPIEDYSIPTWQQLDTFMSFVNKMEKDSKPVLVHCDSGLGRTGSLLAIYLVAKGYPAKEAIDTVRRGHPQSIHTREQENIIFKFESEH